MKKILVFALALAFAACNSTKEIPTDLTSSQLIQRGQDAVANGRYKLAERYYRAALERFGNDVAVSVEATYEIGNLYYKQKKYEDAYVTLQGLIDLYQSSSPGLLPGAFYKLSNIVLEKIPKDKVPQLKEQETKSEK